MEFISTKGMSNEDAPTEKVLVQYLEPSFGGWCVEFAIGYFDNPNEYGDGNGDGWKHWTTNNNINVLSYCILPKEVESPLTKLTQSEFLDKFGYHPSLGNAGDYE